MMSPPINDVRQRAIEITLSQMAVPKSPASRDDKGRINLCLAAIVAKAGFLSTGRLTDAANLERDLADCSSADRLERAFVELGWDRGDCRAKMNYNDSLSEADRKAAVLEYLATLECSRQ